MELSATQGGFIEQVIPNSAASEAGIKAGDVITQINGKNIRSFSELRGKIGSIGAGKSIKLTIVRGDDKPKVFKVKLKRADSSNVAASTIHPMLEGSELVNNSQGIGVTVTSVAPNSPALLIGLEPNDIIVGINRLRINNLAELRKSLKEQQGVFALKIVRGNQNLYLMVR